MSGDPDKTIADIPLNGWRKCDTVQVCSRTGWFSVVVGLVFRVNLEQWEIRLNAQQWLIRGSWCKAKSTPSCA